MRLSRAGPTCTARAFILSIALVVLGSARLPLWQANTQIIDLWSPSNFHMASK
jgi:hypothetical protein